MNFARYTLAIQALRELGLRPLGMYSIYQLGLHSGHYRRHTSHAPKGFQTSFMSFLRLPEPARLRQSMGAAGERKLLLEADEIVSGRVRLFGGDSLLLNLVPEGTLQHWTAYAGEQTESEGGNGVDIKLTWEPARFGWAYTIGRAYLLSGDQRFPAAFWQYLETFLSANPVYYGPNWVSAQEVALRLIAFAWARQVFNSSPLSTKARLERLDQAIGEHAARLPITLPYARSQNNNHLLSEAAGLFTAGVCLPGHPQAKQWQALGWKWFQRGLQSQIDEDGVYCQHSVNYHRLMLQLACWFNSLVDAQQRHWPAKTLQRLASSVHWLATLVDPETGTTPNLGPNDGAVIQPLSSCPFADYRPVLQAAAQLFLGARLFPEGPWDEMSAWYGGLSGQPARLEQTTQTESPHILRSYDQRSWAYLRMAHFHGRPGHADQLHLDLWRDGQNLAMDAGTFQYNAAPPWNNALSNTSVHNTITVDGQEQMRRAGRFLYLDWAQAQRLDGEPDGAGAWRRLVGQHNGYRRLGLLHRRSVAALPDGAWQIEDLLLPARPNLASAVEAHSFRLHWLLPDWPWDFKDAVLHLQSPSGMIKVAIEARANGLLEAQAIGLARAGQRLIGDGPVDPTWGWHSPTYAQKLPALAFFCSVCATAPVEWITRWSFPVDSSASSPLQI